MLVVAIVAFLKNLKQMSLRQRKYLANIMLRIS
jgi:hypothetical protein